MLHSALGAPGVDTMTRCLDPLVIEAQLETVAETMRITRSFIQLFLRPDDVSYAPRSISNVVFVSDILNELHGI